MVRIVIELEAKLDRSLDRCITALREIEYAETKEEMVKIANQVLDTLTVDVGEEERLSDA